jgi:fumarylacetoacetate (FAA) hydrolase family protein
MNNADLQLLPDDHEQATLLGRIWRPGAMAGPSIVLVEKGEVYDITASHPLMAEILSSEDPLQLVRSAVGREHVGSAPELMA